LSLNRSEKEAVINEVTSLAAKAQTLVMAEYRGITVASMDQLRISARKSGVSLSVLKNTLARRAVAGSAFEVVADKMTASPKTPSPPRKWWPISRRPTTSWSFAAVSTAARRWTSKV
jgi:hypothetical protein